MPNQLTPATRQLAIHAMKRWGHSFACPYYGDQIIESALLNEYCCVDGSVQKGWRDIHLGAARHRHNDLTGKEKQFNLQLIRALEAVASESPGISRTWGGGKHALPPGWK